MANPPKKSIPLPKTGGSDASSSSKDHKDKDKLKDVETTPVAETIPVEAPPVEATPPATPEPVAPVEETAPVIEPTSSPVADPPLAQEPPAAGALSGVASTAITLALPPVPGAVYIELFINNVYKGSYPGNTTAIPIDPAVSGVEYRVVVRMKMPALRSQDPGLKGSVKLNPSQFGTEVPVVLG